MALKHRVIVTASVIHKFLDDGPVPKSFWDAIEYKLDESGDLASTGSKQKAYLEIGNLYSVIKSAVNANGNTLHSRFVLPIQDYNGSDKLPVFSVVQDMNGTIVDLRLTGNDFNAVPVGVGEAIPG